MIIHQNGFALENSSSLLFNRLVQISGVFRKHNNDKTGWCFGSLEDLLSRLVKMLRGYEYVAEKQADSAHLGDVQVLG
jgi:hypothetical protein